ncbi:MAG: DUF2225 domain-containing protein [Bacillota bacterium]
MVDVAQLARLGGIKKYPTDEVLFNKGDEGREMYIILRGKVAVLVDSPDGSPVTIAALGPGDFFGEMSLLEGLPRSATIQALEDTTVITIDESNFELVIAKQPQIAYRIMKGLSSRLRSQNEELSRLKAEKMKGATSPAKYTRAPQGEQTVGASLFPAGHKAYSLDIACDDNLLLDREVTCPVCENTFNEKAVRSSKLRLETVDPDFRKRYIGFEPLWYLVWVCPHCYYANFDSEFKQITEIDKKLLLEKGKALKSKVVFNTAGPRKINDVFLAYYLMLQTLDLNKKPDPGKRAKVWLRLAWLYDDVDDKEMMAYAFQQAYELYKESYFNQNHNYSAEQEQQLSLILGELSLRVGDYAEAAKYFRGAINRKGGNAALNRKAEDRIQDLRDRIRLESQQPKDN